MQITEEKVDQALKDMYLNGMHYGYSATSRNPKMKPYIFGLKNGVEIFDLEKTKACLIAAKEFVKKLGAENKTILFVGTKKEAKEGTEKYAKELGMPYVKERWIGGMITNFKQIKARVDHFNDLKKKRNSGDLDKYTKKEKLNIEREIEKMDKIFGGISDTLKNNPAALIIIDPKHEKISFKEALNAKIPTIALLNSDCDPTGIKYPVPANDNSLMSANYFLAEIAASYKDGLALSLDKNKI